MKTEASCASLQGTGGVDRLRHACSKHSQRYVPQCLWPCGAEEGVQSRGPKNHRRRSHASQKWAPAENRAPARREFFVVFLPPERAWKALEKMVRSGGKHTSAKVRSDGRPEVMCVMCDVWLGTGSRLSTERITLQHQ